MSAAVAPRSVLRAVALPTEHGGWGLTLEPVLLGLIVAPTLAGTCIGLAALVAFLARTPAKVVLVDRRRHRTLDRTRLAGRVFAVEAVVLVALALAVAATARATSGFWWPLALMLPLVAVQLWFDVRSRSRRLLPELAGAVGIGGVAALIMLAGGEPTAIAGAAWMVLAARAVSGIVTVRDQVGRLHGRAGNPRQMVFADLTAAAIAVVAVGWSSELLAGAVAVLVAIAVQRFLARWPSSRAVVLGLRQLAIGLALVLATGLGIVAG